MLKVLSESPKPNDATSSPVCTPTLLTVSQLNFTPTSAAPGVTTPTPGLSIQPLTGVDDTANSNEPLPSSKASNSADVANAEIEIVPAPKADDPHNDASSVGNADHVSAEANTATAANGALTNNGSVALTAVPPLSSIPPMAPMTSLRIWSGAIYAKT
ncbi:hypothetical protein ACLKA6_015883 [Drosophila palustris]